MSKRPPPNPDHGPVRRVLGNLGYLLRGRVAAALMTLGATTLMARALGPAEFGVVMLIESYALLVRGVLNFRAFEAVVRFGVPFQDDGDTRQLKRLLRVCRRVDWWSSAGSTAVALVLVPVASRWMGVGVGNTGLLLAYSLVLLTTGNSTADGILRLFDRFDSLGLQMTIGAAVMLVGVVAAWLGHAPMWVFVLIMGVGYCCEELYMSWRGWGEYRARMGRDRGRELADLKTARMREFPGLKHFLWVTYWQSNMDLVPKHLATVLSGFILGATDAGLFRLARQISSILTKPAILIRQVVFPDLTRSWHQRDGAFRLITYRTALYAGLLGSALVALTLIFGHWLLTVWVGEAFTAAVPLLALMMLAATFDFVAASFRAAAYAVDQAGAVLKAYMLGTVFYLVFFLGFTSWIGLEGIGVAAATAAGVPLLIMAIMVHQVVRRAEAHAGA